MNRSSSCLSRKAARVKLNAMRTTCPLSRSRYTAPITRGRRSFFGLTLTSYTLNTRPGMAMRSESLIAMILDVGREQGRVAAPDDHLLAEIRGAPVHLKRELVRLHDLGRLTETL